MEKEEHLRERESVIVEKEKLADDILRRLDHRELSLKEREALLLEVEERVAVCYTAIEGCMQKEIQQGVEVWLTAEEIRDIRVVFNNYSRKSCLSRKKM